MRISRAFRSPRLLAANLMLGANPLLGASLLPGASPASPDGAVQASGATRPPSPRASAAGNATHLSHGRFKDLLIYKPAGPPTSFVLLLSGDEGWNSTADAMARQLAQQGAMVAGIDWTKFKANL